MNTQKENNNRDKSIWKKYFSGWNFIINALIAFIPASITITILREMGLGGALIIVRVLWGFIYLVGLLREKISKKSKRIIEGADKIENEKVIKNDKQKNKKIVWIVILLVVVGVIIFFSILNKQQKSIDENSTLTNIDQEEIIGNLYRNNQYKFRIKFPDGWEIKDGDGPHVIKEATQEGSTIYVLVRDFLNEEMGQILSNNLRQEYKKVTNIDISGSEAKQAMTELTADDFSNKDFEEMMSGISEKLLSKYEGKILNEEIRYMNNKKAFYVKSEIVLKTLDFEVQGIMVCYATLYNGNIYMIGGGSPKHDFPTIEKQIDLSVASFVFENL